jgi:outer membrane protein W
MFGLLAMLCMAFNFNVLADGRAAYVGANVGFNYNLDNRFDVGGNTIRISYQPGVMGRVYLGYQWVPLRLDVELAAHQNKIDNFTVNTTAQTHSGTLSSQDAMVNASYLFDGFSAIVEPYVGLGAGVVRVHQNSTTSTVGNYTNVNTYKAAAQALFGAYYNLDCRTSVILDYRALISQKFDWQVWNSNLSAMDHDSQHFVTHDFSIGLLYRF